MKIIVKLLNILLTGGFLFQQSKRNLPMLFVRGDGVILISPLLKVGY